MLQASIPEIAAIIPSLNRNTDDLVHSLTSQTWPPSEIRVVRGVRPNGRARNLGIMETSSPILLLIDDDAMPCSPDLVESLVQPLITDESIGLTGAARVLPENASWFQRRVAYEIPRTVNDVESMPKETNPPLKGYGHSLITTTCCALRRSVYKAAGGFSNDLTSGVDTDFFYRVRSLNYRFVMVPNVSVEHPAPGDLLSLIRKFYWYGIGYGQEAQLRPQQGMGIPLMTIYRRSLFLLASTLWLIPNIFILYSYSYPHFEIGFRPLKALSTYATAWGYVKGWKNGT